MNSGRPGALAAGEIFEGGHQAPLSLIQRFLVVGAPIVAQLDPRERLT